MDAFVQRHQDKILGVLSGCDRVQEISQRLKTHAQQLAEKHQRPYIYLESSALSKEDQARHIMERDGIKKGLVCVLSCVEPCQTYALKKDRPAERVKHWVEENSIKMYDKQGSVLRIETTINNPRRLKVRRGWHWLAFSPTDVMQSQEGAMWRCYQVLRLPNLSLKQDPSTELRRGTIAFTRMARLCR